MPVIHEVKNGMFISLDEAKGYFIDETAYAPGQYPHPVKNVPEDIMKQAQTDFETEHVLRVWPENVTR